MDALRRLVTQSPKGSIRSAFRRSSNNETEVNGDASSSKEVNGEEQNNAVVFQGLQYLGSTLVDCENGEATTSHAIKRIRAMGPGSSRKNQSHGVRVSLSISPQGITVTDQVRSTVLQDVSIYRISYCGAEKRQCQGKIFAFIARSTLNETLECHAFLCHSAKLAQCICLSVGQSFQAAAYLEREEEKFRQTADIIHPKDDSTPVAESTPSSGDSSIKQLSVGCESPYSHVTVHTSPTEKKESAGGSSSNGRTSGEVGKVVPVECGDSGDIVTVEHEPNGAVVAETSFTRNSESTNSFTQFVAARVKQGHEKTGN